MTGKDFLYSLAAELAWRDGREDGINGMLAVLFVLRNRMALNGWDLREALGKLWGMDVTYGIPDVRDPSFAAILDMVEGVFDPDIPLVDRLTNGATNYGYNYTPHDATHTAKVGGLHLYK